MQYSNSDRTRFWSNTRPSNDGECLLWTGAASNYGAISIAGKKGRGAHRVAWELAHDAEVPAGMVVRHSCDTPLCVNPAHLQLGTQSDNIRDSIDRGRWPTSNRTECPQGHPYDTDNTYITKNGWRLCRACRREGMARARVSR